MDNDMILVQVWEVVSELCNQLEQNQKLASALKTQAGTLNDQASQTTAGFALRRVIADISKESFESETERLNAQILIENQTLLQEHWQLNLLLKEHEDTMKKIMTKFQNHSLAAQQHELTLTRHYEALLAARDSQTISSDFVNDANLSQSLQRLCHYLRGLLKTMAGENYDPYNSDYGLGFEASDLEDLTALLETLDERSGSYPDTESREDWAVERESEISRLERENEELRQMLGIDEANMAAHGVTVEPDRIGRGRNSIPNSRRSPSSEQYAARPSYWETSGQAIGSLQSVMELQPGMRMGPQARRTGIFGAGQQRGGFAPGGAGRGVSLAINGPGTPSLWGNQPTTPMAAPPLWQLQGGSSGLDLNR